MEARLKILLKLFANLRVGREKEQLLEVGNQATALEAMALAGIPPEEVAIVMVNGRRVAADAVLQEQDTVSLFPPVGGG